VSIANYWPKIKVLTGADEVSALVVDFGTYTTRAGYAGEDCPRIVCPSFFGYTDAESSSAGAAGDSGGGGGEDVNMEDGTGTGAGGAAGTNGANGKAKSRKYYVGDDGVGVWRPEMEVGNFMLDGIGQSTVPHQRRKK
jgi:hypothetical protein